MNRKHAIIELPAKSADFDQIVSDKRHDIISINFSSPVVENEVKHFAFVVWQDYEYGEHMF
jgi:hypothetical protein